MSKNRLPWYAKRPKKPDAILKQSKSRPGCLYVLIHRQKRRRQVSRRHINTYLNVPVYKAFHEWLGRTEALGPMWQAWESGDRKGAVAAIPESVIDELILRGSVDNIHAHVKRYMEAGVTTAFLQLQSFDKDPAVKRDRLLKALRALAPGEELG